MPALNQFVSKFRHRFANYILPNRPLWVQVRRGTAAGTWLKLNLASERNWWSGNHEPAVQEHLSRIVHPGTIFYDIGAHIGFFSLAAARSGAQVISFEADPENVTRLQMHVEKNGLSSKITFVEAAVWSSGNRKIAFQRGWPRSQGGVTDHGIRPVLASGSTISVNSITIDDFVAEGAAVPDILKIDVEGGEVEVLKGATGVIRAHRPKLVIEVHHRDARIGIETLLEEFSYSAVWLAPREGFPQQCFAQPTVG